MKKLFLASSFRTSLSDKTLKNELLNFLSKKPEDILIAHIPNAADPQENKSYVKESTDQLKAMGMKIREIDLKKENRNSIKEKFIDCDVIFVNGGNTFYLLDVIRKSGLDKILPDLLDQGKIYIAASAGSYVVCPTIEAAGWKHADRNIVGLKNLEALNLIPFIITAHYNREKYHDSIEYGVKKTKLPVVALYDTQAIVVEGDKVKVVGTGQKEFFNGFKENV
ncbi:MAG: Type 1 glutamine amidotransferase-like domain-containing protein [Patescibacteria group bacterium]